MRKGQCIGGIRTVEDVRQRCYVAPDGCWHWRGYVTSCTPLATINGKPVSVRRWVLQQTRPLQRGRVFVVAMCGHKTCVAPGCAVSKRGPAFMRWMVESGYHQTTKHRGAIKEATRRRSTLTPAAAAEIARRIHAGEDRGAVAAAFGITRSHANAVARGRYWGEYVTPAAVLFSNYREAA